MCGVAGIFGPHADGVRVAEMLRAIAHRGDPEHGGEMRVGPGFALGADRLAIVDPDAGRQPFVSDDGAIVCVNNGEIYNHGALRAALSADARFRTRCDTEVLLHAWSVWGQAAPERLQGMFAFAVHDARRGLWALCRDPLGIKPLLYVRTGRSIAFASEAKALTGFGAPIEALAPGSLLTPQGRQVFAPLGDFGEDGVAGPSASELRQALEAAVASHLPPAGDRVAILLSGGVDSSTVLMLARELHRGPVEAFTIAIDGAPSEDMEAARHLCDALDTPLHLVSPSCGELQSFYLASGVRMAETFEPALVRNATIYHFVCRAIRAAGYKFCLSGEGADELFGGYDYFRRADKDARDALILRSLREIHATYLQMADRAAMFASLEVRVPYMDYRFVRVAIRLPPKLRIGGGLNKRALRELYRDRLPPANRLRPKLGMNAGAGYGSNDPGEGIYARAVASHYAARPDLRAADLARASHYAEEFELNIDDLEEVFDFARYVEAGYVAMRLEPRRPQLNTSRLRPPAVSTAAFARRYDEELRHTDG